MRALRGKRAAMVVFSFYPMDPRPRRAAEALVREGMEVDLVCLREAGVPIRERVNGVRVLRLPLRRSRGGPVAYVLEYAAFVLACTALLGARAWARRYDLVHVHNMPDVLVLSAWVPKALGAKVILDLHDPMPELLTTIFRLGRDSRACRILRRLEKWSIRRADLALTPNLAFQRLFVSRSCPAGKMRIVMNSPDEDIFGFRPAGSNGSGRRAAGRPPVIMYHGSLVERNGPDLAVAALGLVRRSIPDVELRIYGPESPFLSRVLEAVRATDLSAAVRYLGPRDVEGIVRAIEECDVGIVPNRRNAFTELNLPTRIFEYLAMGKPVIAPRSPGILDYFGEQSLVLFEPGDAADLARRIEHVLLRPGEAIETVERGQAVYRAHTWRQERGRLLGLVDDLLARGDRGR